MHTQDQRLIERLRVEQTGVPIYVQLRDQVLLALSTGVLRPGDQMPTMRQVAVALRVDLNTVRHAYDELERRGAITLIRGRGSFVAERPPQDEVGSSLLDDLARQVLAAASAAGVSPAALAQRVAELATGKETQT